MPDSCKHCRFWLADPKAGTDNSLDDEGPVVDPFPGFGRCRRNPPVISDHMAQMAIGSIGFGGLHCDPEDIADANSVHNACLWPVTWHRSWCGEYQPEQAASAPPIGVDLKNACDLHRHLHQQCSDHPIGDTFLDSPEYPAVAEDHDQLLHQLRAAYDVVLAIAPSTGVDIAAKLDALLLENGGFVIKEREVQLIADQARQLGEVSHA